MKAIASKGGSRKVRKGGMLDPANRYKRDKQEILTKEGRFMNKGQRIKQEDFNRVKQFQEADILPWKTAQLLGFQPSTVGKIYKLETFEEMYPAKETKPTVPDELVEILKNINSELVDINKRLKWLEEHVPVADRKFFFGGKR